MPSSRRRRRRSANLKGTRAPSTIQPENDETNEDDDFIPPMPRRPSSNTGDGLRNTAREHSRTTSTWHTTNKEIGHGPTMIAQDDDEDNNFMP